MANQMSIEAVNRILYRKDLSDWARKYWTKVLAQILLLNQSEDDLVSRSAGLPHLWSQTGHPLNNELSGGQTNDRYTLTE